MHADQLNVSCGAEDSFAGPLERYLVSISAQPQSLGPGKVLWRFPSCEVKNSILITRRRGYHVASLSGGALGHIRQVEHWWQEVLWLLGSVPHTVSKLDIAHDVRVDGADTVDALQGIVPGETSKLLGRKGLPVEWFLAQRDSDERYTGTMYIGRGTSARLKLKVYDKAFERRVNAGLLLPPTTRYELTFMKDYKGGGISLRDAYEPERLFWDGMPPELLSRPPGVAPWSPADGVGWSAGSRPDSLPADVLSRRLQDSAELDVLARIADEMGPGGRVWLLRRLAERLGVEVSGSLSLAPVRAPEASQG